MIAALYVLPNGPYYGLEGIECWDKQRDARKYPGPHRVIAHPPCERWCQLAHIIKKRYGYEIGDDGGCFESALAAVRRWGGLLEHPARTLAWKHFGLPLPKRGCWSPDPDGDAWVTEVSQAAYGHRARKLTWLYYVGDSEPSALDWSIPEPTAQVSYCKNHGNSSLPRLTKKQAKATPIPFRDLLISIVRNH